MEGLTKNRSLVELETRECQCGDVNTHNIRLRLTENQLIHGSCDTAAEDDQWEEDDDEEEYEDDAEEGDEEDARDTRT